MEHHPWTRFVAIGDSITEGYGMDPVEGVEHLPWAERLARELRATRPAFELHNLAWRNLRAAEIVESQLPRAVALEPDLVSIAAGANDMLDPDFERERIERDLEPLYAAFAGTGATVFTYTYMDMPGSGILPDDGAAWLRARMEVLHDAIRALASRHGALVVDVFADPESADPAFFSADRQHANALGQAYVAGRTLAALEAEAMRRSSAAA